MKIHRLTALLLSLLLLFSCALAESTDDKLMATVNGEELRFFVLEAATLQKGASSVDVLVRGLCEGMERDKPTVGTASHSGNRVESSRRASTNQQINHQTNPQEISKTKNVNPMPMKGTS